MPTLCQILACHACLDEIRSVPILAFLCISIAIVCSIAYRDRYRGGCTKYSTMYGKLPLRRTWCSELPRNLLLIRIKTPIIPPGLVMGTSIRPIVRILISSREERSSDYSGAVLCPIIIIFNCCEAGTSVVSKKNVPILPDKICQPVKQTDIAGPDHLRSLEKWITCQLCRHSITVFSGCAVLRKGTYSDNWCIASKEWHNALKACLP